MTSSAIRTRFAPSPTGTLHLGNIRTALFAWAFARHHKGQFVLRIEDTDLERSSDASADGILRDMKWLGLDIDEGPFFQMQRMDRYREVVAQMLADGRAYHCYMSVEELDALREKQKANNEKPRYDGRWRPENIAKLGLKIPAGVDPVVRFRNPDAGVVAWDDAVKGRIEIANTELDDLVIARPAPVGQVGVPTYNFCVVVDDIDMQISHVIRGDGHVMNTPRQINIFRAMGVEPPVFGHTPTVLGNDGEKLSKRHGATGLNEYAANGFLPEAVINGLARLGWSHGNDEIFSPQQLVEWFNLESLTPSPARFDAEKFEWLNGEHIKRLPVETLAQRLEPFLLAAGYAMNNVNPSALAVAELLRERAPTLKKMAEMAAYCYVPPTIDAALLAQHLNDVNRGALQWIKGGLTTVEWSKPAIAAVLKEAQGKFNVKTPQVMMPLRVLLTGSAQAPAVDALLLTLGREASLARIAVG
ncbi:MAG: glutamate--tRNA ligase [Burkholderiales bacterium]|nr:MAG: glutamate--tRNA ligase [Betaproteobacteria bacterium]TAG23823.1 MAG: glutamate--tRNA ligase [Burkholderiales bacterium]